MAKPYIANYWHGKMNDFEKHDPLTSCSDFLQRPKHKFRNIIVQCPECGKLYVGSYVPPTGTAFWKTFEIGELS